MRWVTGLAILVCAVVGPPGDLALPAGAQTVPTMVADASRSVCIVLAERGNGTTSGTGFVVADGFILTADHVVQDADHLRALCPDHPSIVAKLVTEDRDNDVAVLQGTLSSRRPLPFGTSATVQVGQEIVVIGFPRADLAGAETATVTQGIVSSVRPAAFQIQVPLGPGNSGSPVLTLQGQVIGVVRAVLGSQVGTNLATSFATAIDAVKPFLTFGVNVGHAPPVRQTPEPGLVITPGRSIGDVKLGMSRNELEHLLGHPKQVSRNAAGGFLINWFVQVAPPVGFYAYLSSAGEAIMIGVANDSRYILQGLHTGSTEIEVRAALGEPSRTEIVNDPSYRQQNRQLGAAKLLYYDALGLRFLIGNDPQVVLKGLVANISIFRLGCIFRGLPAVLQGGKCA